MIINSFVISTSESQRRRAGHRADPKKHLYPAKIFSRITGPSILLSLLIVWILLFFPVTQLHAETYVSGTISAHTTWTLTGSPYIVTGDITVHYSSYNNSTATLTIEPGVEVRFNAGTGLYVGYYGGSGRKYYGALSAQGTDGSPIT
ncbi:MAG: hypothetical protein JRJ86_14755, partial [Deltaproteobacteria bacterium]|nr:hypothetical protein [Deltaproteobacteria bacterium]